MSDLMSLTLFLLCKSHIIANRNMWFTFVDCVFDLRTAYITIVKIVLLEMSA